MVPILRFVLVNRAFQAQKNEIHQKNAINLNLEQQLCGLIMKLLYSLCTNRMRPHSKCGTKGSHPRKIARSRKEEDQKGSRKSKRKKFSMCPQNRDDPVNNMTFELKFDLKGKQGNVDLGVIRLS